jgi:hypothetical protein
MATHIAQHAHLQQGAQPFFGGGFASIPCCPGATWTFTVVPPGALAGLLYFFGIARCRIQRTFRDEVLICVMELKLTSYSSPRV